MIDGDKYFLISSEELNRLNVLLEDDDILGATFYLEDIVKTKIITFDSPFGGLIFFD